MVNIRIFRAPRRSDAPDEYEDAAFPEESGALGFPVRVAVADGATLSSFSGQWARTLVGAWGDGTLGEDLTALPALAARWRAEVGALSLPWFAAEKARSGAHAALLGLHVEEGGGFLAMSAGDCCLFQIRADALLAAFPPPPIPKSWPAVRSCSERTRAERRERRRSPDAGRRATSSC